MALRKPKPKDPMMQFVDDLGKEFDYLIKVYMKENPHTNLSENFPCVLSLMGASSMVSVIKNMIKK